MSLHFLDGEQQVFIEQQKEWTEILSGLETRNRYEVKSARKERIGSIVEKSGGFWGHLQRLLLRSHRNFTITIADAQNKVLAVIDRPFHWFFSELSITAFDLRPIGTVKQRFGVLNFRYDLCDESGRVFARVTRPLWRVWTLPVIGIDPRKRATIAKKWSGVLREALTDADTFGVHFEHAPWSDTERAVIFAAAVTIDLDIFEDNAGARGWLQWR